MKKYLIPEIVVEIYELEDAILSSTKLEAKNETLTGFRGWQEEL